MIPWVRRHRAWLALPCLVLAGECGWAGVEAAVQPDTAATGVAMGLMLALWFWAAGEE